MTLSIGAVNLTIATGSVAQASVATGRGPIAIVGPSSAGPIGVPTPASSKQTIVSAFARGPLVEAAAYALAYEVPSVLLVRTDTAGGTAGAYGSITETSVDGTVAGDGTVKPDDDFEVVFEALNNFTVGTTGGQYRYSLDGGRKWSGTTALGTATSVTLPYGAGKYNFVSGEDWLEGEGFSLTTAAPRWSSDALVEALEALRDTSRSFGLIEIVGPFATSGEINAVQAALLDMRRKVKYRRAVGHFRSRNAGETAAAYAAAFEALVATVDADCLSLTPSWYAPSAINPGAVYVRPFSFAAAPRTAKLREDISADSRTEWGSCTGQIRDSAGQVLPRAVDEWDNELFTPLRGFAPRTWADKSASQIYAGQGATLAAEGSDTQLLRVAQVLDAAAEAAYPALADRVGRGLLPATDGTLDPNEKKRIEGEVSKILDASLVGTGKAVRARLVIDPGQTIITTGTVTITGRVLVRIKGYIDEFEIAVSVDVTGS